jgi:hypothetical protein
MVVGLIFFLTFLEIPDKNKDLITSIIGMLVGSISMAISIFVGRDPDDVAALKGQIEELSDDRNTLIARLRDAQIDKDILRRQHEGLQALVISKLSVFAEDKRLGELASLADERSIPEEVARWIPGERAPQIPATMTPLSKRSPLDDILGGEDKS